MTAAEKSPPRPPGVIPPVPAGAVLTLEPADWYEGDRRLVFEVERAMPEISGYYPRQLWLSGWEIQHRRRYRMHVLVPFRVLTPRT